MTKEQTDELFWGHGIEFYPDGMCKQTRFTRQDFEDLIEQVWNKAIETAADNAEADVNIITEEGQYEIQNLQLGYDYEVYVLKESILKLKT